MASIGPEYRLPCLGENCPVLFNSAEIIQELQEEQSTDSYLMFRDASKVFTRLIVSGDCKEVTISRDTTDEYPEFDNNFEGERAKGWPNIPEDNMCVYTICGNSNLRIVSGIYEEIERAVPTGLGRAIETIVEIRSYIN